MITTMAALEMDLDQLMIEVPTADLQDLIYFTQGHSLSGRYNDQQIK